MRISVDFTKKPVILTQVSERNTMNVDHRGRSNDDCPLITEMQKEVKQLKEIERRRKLNQIWESIHPIDRPTWEQWKRGMVTLPQTQRDRDFPIAAMEDRKRRKKEWAEHMAKKLAAKLTMAEVERCEALTTQHLN
jgi:hypothetical protein